MVQDGLKERLDAIAAKEARTIKAVVVRAIERYLAAAENELAPHGRDERPPRASQ